MSQQGKDFKQRYYRTINSLRPYRPVLHSVIVQSEHVAAGENFKQRHYRINNTLSLCRPALISGNLKSEYVAAVVCVQTKILLEHEQFKPL